METMMADDPGYRVMVENGTRYVPEEDVKRLIEDSRLNYEGAMSDLESVVTAFARRCKAEADWQSAIPYIVANYPKQARTVFGLSVARPSPAVKDTE
jgi:hypothetical protein